MGKTKGETKTETKTEAKKDTKTKTAAAAKEVVEEKTKRQMYEIPDERTFERMVDSIVAKLERTVRALYADRKTSEIDENAPSQTEINALIKGFRDPIVRKYTKLFRLKITKTKNGPREDKGFKTPSYATAPLVKFINKHCDLPDDLKLKPVLKNGGAIFNRSQGTSALSDYIERNNLKVTDKRSIIVPDDNLDKLFVDHYDSIKKASRIEYNGKQCFTHATLQSLCANLFYSKLTVPESKYTPDQKELLHRRERWLSERTGENKARRKQVDDEKRADRDRERIEKNAQAAAKASVKAAEETKAKQDAVEAKKVTEKVVEKVVEEKSAKKTAEKVVEEKPAKKVTKKK